MSQGNNLPRVKVSNQAAIKRIVYLYGPITRLEVSRMLDLTLPTITTNIASLLRNGIIQEVAKDKNSIGRRSTLLDIVPSSRHYIGVELRQPGRFACLIDLDGKILMKEEEASIKTTYEDVISSAADVVRRLLVRCEAEGIEVNGMGVTMPGIVDCENGILKTVRQYRWFDKPVCAELASMTGFTGPVLIENDAASRAVAANLFDGYGLKDKDSYAYLYVSNGVSCRLMHNNGDYTSVSIGPGEMGYMVMDPHLPFNENGSSGMLSEFAGERAIKAKCRIEAQSGNAPWLKAFLAQCGTLHFDTLLEAQREGDTGVDRVLCEAARFLGIALANFDNIVRPDTCIIEAKLFGNEKNREIFMRNMEENTFRHESDRHDFRFVTPDDYLGARGAAAVALQHGLGLYIEAR